ncbi:MAG: Gfo/Idh/MocA family oxidoreductase [Pseudomonadota bacterium]
MTAPLRLAFVGGSTRSAVGYAHFAAARMDGRFNLVAGAFSRDSEINRETAQTYGVDPRRVHQRLDDLIAHERDALDAVAVLTPTPSHADFVAQCLDAGLPVICEKALAGTVDDAVRLRDQAERLGGFLAVTYNYSGYPMVRELRHRIRRGELGRVLQIHAEMPQESFIRRAADGSCATPQTWRLEDGAIPTLHLDLAVHIHQLIDYLTGLKPREVTAVANRYGRFEDVVDNVVATARYEEDALANLWFSKSAIGHRNGLKLRIYGDQASAEWVQSDPETLLISYADGRREILDRGGDASEAGSERYTRFKAGHPAGYVEAFANLYANIADCLFARRTGETAPSDEVFGADLALEGLQFLDTMTKAAEQRAWLRVPLQHRRNARSSKAA